ncbi:maleate cis-trans isomerase family protein [Amycolatopsis anabasis]|uniref:maleate cis-trans isomerase family protein n=1 Tax=Amycolatopsis anabasis TaxID=1840409 RepID=UPI00131B795E|nr:decarboxylase [Amycolatopsis anabasis]
MGIDDVACGETRIGVLYPTRGAGEDDYLALAERLTPGPAAVAAEYVTWGAGVHRLADLDPLAKLRALREVGEEPRLLAAAERLRGFAPDVVTWTCSSCSFLRGRAGARRQADALAERLGVPASSTSLAFLAAAAALGVTRVALGSVYSGLVTAVFVEFLATAGIETVHRIELDAGSDREVAAWGPEKLLEIVRAADHPRAEALLIPETALHTADCLPELELAAGKPVLTATHVTLWDALRHAGNRRPRPHLGALFTVDG